jgi:hypothetical protein
MLKPSDFVVLLKIVALDGQRWTYANLAESLFLSASEVHGAVKRLAESRLLQRDYTGYPKQQPNAFNPNLTFIVEFAIHGAKFCFAPEHLPSGRGMPTGPSAPVFDGVFVPGHEDIVWPWGEGTKRGPGLKPLYRMAPAAALLDRKLYDMLALFDALRAGRARERGMALTRLPAMIDPEIAKQQAELAATRPRPLY